ncbi:MAG: hypothetical protein MK078_03765 [Crocinitomicaceae bacterium]|nr:hypothetical protein [Crocinitomicaceae bacterium]
MKKLIYILLFVLPIAACNKDGANPRKYTNSLLAGNYSIEEYTSDHHGINYITNVDINTTTHILGATGNINETWYDGGSSIYSTDQSINILLSSMVISENGTWEMTIEYYYIQEGGITPYNVKTKKSGTWSFVGKTKGEFEKNERIIISVLRDYYWEEAALQYEGNYSDGQNSKVFVIKELTSSNLHLLGEWTNEGDGLFFPILYQTNYDPFRSSEKLELKLAK